MASEIPQSMITQHYSSIFFMFSQGLYLVGFLTIPDLLELTLANSCKTY